ncbi:MAG TPA: RtcB family protein [Symbiobacteriaceae bacterium]|nr:RtcB family protein [Symbiobacteriaceae bacterium]
MFREIDGVRVWGEPQEGAVQQAVQCSWVGDVAAVALMADHHLGYSQPIGGVVAYRGFISPSGVGYDIGCGNKAVRTNLSAADIRKDLPRLMDEIYRQVSFGLGRKQQHPVDHELFDDPTWADIKQVGALKDLAQSQLGTVGSGNHFVDLFEEPATGAVWVGVHFGSRGFGHKTASGFLNLAEGRPFGAGIPRGEMNTPPTVLKLSTDLGQAYLAAMRLAGRYAYAGRDYVVSQVLKILHAKATFEVHNHHNFAWVEEHGGEELVVVRKGATPLMPGQLGFIGGSMADIAVIVQGRDSEEARAAFHSACHGAGRVMSRMAALGRRNPETGQREGGRVTPEAMQEAIRTYGVELRGAGVDESPFVYRKLQDVLDAHAETLDVLHVLRPIGVAMAGGDVRDPYKD